MTSHAVSRDKIHVLSRGVLVEKEHILLCKTLDLNSNFYFLPGGHVEHEESLEQALIREFIEEAGDHSLELRRLLGCLEYTFIPGHNTICHNHEYNFIFEVASRALVFPQVPQQRESHIAFEWLPLASLRGIDFRPEPLKDCLYTWLDASGVLLPFVSCLGGGFNNE